MAVRDRERSLSEIKLQDRLKAERYIFFICTLKNFIKTKNYFFNMVDNNIH